MEKFVITGGKPLHGEVTISGAKNAAVGILPATILAADVCVIENLPDISDVAVSLKILSTLGASIKMLTRNICSEYGEANIQCNGIGPGYIETPQTAPLRERQADGSRHPFDQFIVAKTPAERWGKAEDLGGPAVFLASEASDFVNGLILYVDGGILAYIGKQPG